MTNEHDDYLYKVMYANYIESIMYQDMLLGFSFLSWKFLYIFSFYFKWPRVIKKILKRDIILTMSLMLRSVCYVVVWL